MAHQDVPTPEERVLQQTMQPVAPAAERLFAFLQAPQPEPFLPTPVGLHEEFRCEFGHLYCPHLRPLQHIVGQCLFLIPRLTKDSDPVIAAAIAKYLDEILTAMQRTNPKFAFRWNLFHIDLLLASSDPVLNDLRFPSIAGLRHMQRCLELFDEFNDFEAVQEFLYDFRSFVGAFLHKCGLVLTHRLLWAEAGPDTTSREWASVFGQHLFTAALAGAVLNLQHLSAASCALLRRHRNLDRALLASVITFIILKPRLGDSDFLKDVPPLMEAVIGTAVHDWASRTAVPASRETGLLGVSVESLLRQLLKLLVEAEHPLARVWLGCLLAELKKAERGTLEAGLVQLCIQDDELLWQALSCFLKLENPKSSELQSCLPCRHRLFLEAMKATGFDAEFLIDALLTAESAELGLLTYLTAYLHSDPAAAAAAFSADRAARRRLRVLLLRLHTRLQRSVDLETFPFNAAPLARSLALFRERALCARTD